MKQRRAGTISMNIGKKRFYLLGLMHGHFDIADLNADAVVEDEPGASSQINTGVGVVIPVEQILETINSPTMLEILDKGIEKHWQITGATADTAAEEPRPIDEAVSSG